MTLGRPARTVLVVLVAALAAVLAGCTTVVDGHPRALAAARAPVPTLPPAAAQGPRASVAPAAEVARTVPRTLIGDPLTADLCDDLDGVQLGDANTFPLRAQRQYLPGCDEDVSVDGHAAELAVHLDQPFDLTTTGRTVRAESGLAIYAYPFKNEGGECPRYVLAGPYFVEVRLIAGTSGPGSADTVCGVTDTVTNTLAAALALGHIGRLQLPSPSVDRFDACAVVQASHATTAVPALADATQRGLGFGGDCRLEIPGVVVLVRDALDATDLVPSNTGSPQTDGGHVLYPMADLAAGTQCGFVSGQGRAYGAREEIVVLAESDDTTPLPAGECSAARDLLVRYLDTAGLH